MSEGREAARPLLPFPPGCVTARLVRREKRFTAVCAGADGTELRAHTNNTGSMLGLLRPGNAALLSPAQNPARALQWTLEALAIPGGSGGQGGLAPAWSGVNTQTPNRMLAAAWRAGLLPEARAYARFKPEAAAGGSRLDGLFTGEGLPPLFVECKNVTLVEDGQAQFPDAASQRGRKHLTELARLVQEGARCALFFLVQRPDGGCFAPCEAVDPDYALGLAEALEAGVEAWVWRARITEAGISLAGRMALAPAWAALQRDNKR